MSKKVKWALLGSLVLAVLFGLWSVYDLALRVPDFTRLKESVEVPIRLANGDKAVRNMGPRTPGWTPLSGMSEWLPRAVISSEDGSFYSHKGIDVYEMQEALKKDWKEGRFARGASTITQQVLKNVYLSHYPKVWRKVKEIAWASKIEAALTKPQILSFYLNMAEWGPGIYGIGEASRHYFSVSPASLTPRQSAFLAMLLPSPRRYHAYFREKKLTAWAVKRINRILTVMTKLGQLSPEQYEGAMNEKLWGGEVVADTTPGAPSDPGWDAGESPDEIFDEGAKPLTTTVNSNPPVAETPSSSPVANPTPIENTPIVANPLETETSSVPAPSAAKEINSLPDGPETESPPLAVEAAPED